MFKNNVIKKLSVVIASLALVLPLASVSYPSASARSVNKKQIVRVMKRAHRAKNVKHVRKAHHYYKFAYDKKEYRKYLKDVRVFNDGVKKINEKFNTQKKSRAYKTGFNDALYNDYHKNLINNRQYQHGYVIANAYSVNGNTSKKALKQSQNWFRSLKKVGPGTGSAIIQMKNEAHINTL